MSFLQSRPGENVQFLLDNFSWDSVAQGVLVDVGGAKGPVAVEICRHLPKIKCVVQDLPDVIKGSKIPKDLQNGERLKFMAHDFFQEQPVKGADMYLIHNVLHDWSDKYAARILRNLIPSLKKGAKVLVSDRCLPLPGSLSPFKSRQSRCSDLYMKGIQNAEERDPGDWAQLLEFADPRFKLQEVANPPCSSLSLICATWQGENAF